MHYVFRLISWAFIFPAVSLVYFYYALVVWGWELISRYIISFFCALLFVSVDDTVYWLNKIPYLYVQYFLLMCWLCAVYLWYLNMPVHYRMDRITYTLLGPHHEYNKRAHDHGDRRVPSFRSVTKESEDFVMHADYLRYHVEEINNNVATSRIVVISQAAYNEMCSPINTLKWKEPDDYKNLRADTHNFARSALQRINVDNAIERESDCIFETITMFAWHMKAKRRFPTNFHTPKSV